MAKIDIVKYESEIHSPIFILSLKTKNKGGWSLFQCRFNGCEKEFEAEYAHVVSGHTKSCGCYKDYCNIHGTIKHGMTYTPEYRTWYRIKSRCYNSKHRLYKNYGGRGIKVCDRWLEEKTGSSNFFQDMGFRPSKKHSLHRKNNDKNYTPDNCVWATRDEQDREKTNTVNITYKGKTQLLKDWSKELSISENTLYGRLNRSGWTVERAFETPIRK